MVPVNLRPLDAPLPPELGNEFGFYFVDLPTGPMPPRERLDEMHRRVEEIKGSPEALVAFGVLAGLGASPKLVEDIGVAFFGSKAAGVVTNVPGPRTPVFLAGARVAGPDRLGPARRRHGVRGVDLLLRRAGDDRVLH